MKKQQTSKAYYLEVMQTALNKFQQNDRSFNLNDYADAIGVEGSILSRILSGKRLLSYKTALKVARGLKMNEDARNKFMESVEAQTIDIVEKREVSHESMQRRASEGRKPLPVRSTSGASVQIRDARAKIDRSVRLDAENSFIVVTQAIQGAEVFMPFLKAIENFQARSKAKLVILPGKAHLKPLSDDEYPLDSRLFQDHGNDIYRQVEVNRFLSIIDLDIRPYVVDPLNGLSALGAEDCRPTFGHDRANREREISDDEGHRDVGLQAFLLVTVGAANRTVSSKCRRKKSGGKVLGAGHDALRCIGQQDCCSVGVPKGWPWLS